jgi:hypothetical protein
MNKFTRRELAAGLATSTVLLAQPPSQPVPASPPVPPGPDDELKAALAQIHDNAEQLDKFPLPMSAEPATKFQA